jgi:hypothetical protein
MSVKPLSNEDFSSGGGGLYPGGSGKITDIKYVLWDYNGKLPPNSTVAVHATFEPLDGSNDGNPVEIYWGVGSAELVTPDQSGGLLLPVERTGKEPVRELSDSSNWFQVVNALKTMCNMPSGSLNGSSGIKALAGSLMTLNRVEQKERENMPSNVPANAPGGQGQQKRQFKPTMLIPTMATFAWDMGGKVGGSKPAAAAKAAAATAAASTNGNGAGSDALVSALGKVLAEAGDDGLPMDALVSKLTESFTLAGVPGKQRLVMLNSVKSPDNIAKLATEHGWTWDADNAVLYA